MSYGVYVYEEMKASLFTDDGQRTFLRVRDHVQNLLKVSGACTGGAAINVHMVGDSFQLIACIDRMVELGELRIVCSDGWWQDRVYAAPLSRER